MTFSFSAEEEERFRPFAVTNSNVRQEKLLAAAHAEEASAEL